MSGFSDEEKNDILDERLGVEAWLALVTVAVKGSDKGTTITEPTWTGYARILMKATHWAAAAAGKKHNNIAKVYAECTAGSSTHRGWALCTTEETTSGLIICSGVVPETVVTAGIVPEFDIGALVFGLNDT